MPFFSHIQATSILLPLLCDAQIILPYAKLLRLLPHMFGFGLYGLILCGVCVCACVVYVIRLGFILSGSLFLHNTHRHSGFLALLPNKVNSGKVLQAIGVNLSSKNDSIAINGPLSAPLAYRYPSPARSTHKITHVDHPQNCF